MNKTFLFSFLWLFAQQQKKAYTSQQEAEGEEKSSVMEFLQLDGVKTVFVLRSRCDERGEKVNKVKL